MQEGQSRHHLGHLGQPEQTLQADDLDRDLSSGQRVEHVGGMRVVAGQHADPRPVAAQLLPGADDLLGQPGELVVVRVEHRRPHRSVAAPGRALERADGVGRSEQRLRELVGRLQDPCVRAAAHRQRVHA